MQSFTLNTGAKIPSVGFGCWKVPKDVCADVIENAIKIGYRHLDGACDYGNEKEVGEGIQRAIDKGLCKREDLWITSKLWNTFHHPDHVEMACKKTLSDLGLDYLDLYLIHFPISLKFVPFETRYPPEWFHDPNVENPKMEIVDVPVMDTWREMEKLQKAGLVKHIGVSNFNCQAIRDLMSYAQVKPSVLQVELHPMLPQHNLVRYAQSVGIHVTGFSPLGHGTSYWNDKISALYEPVIKELAKKLGKSEAQIVLRWNLQRNVSIIPKSEKEHRLRENIDLFSFKLDDEDMKRINDEVKNRHRFNDPAVFCENAFNTFCPIFD